MRSRLVLGCLLVVAAGVGACKAEPSKASLPTTTVPATTTTTTREHGYRVQYLNAVSGVNCLSKRLRSAYEAIAAGRGYFTEADWPRIRAELLPVIKAHGEGMVSFYQDLARLEWPPEAAEDIRILTRQATADASLLLAQAQSTTFDAFSAQPGIGSDRSQAAAVRAILGLPSNLVNDDYDWCKGPPPLDPAPPTTTSAPTSASA